MNKTRQTRTTKADWKNNFKNYKRKHYKLGICKKEFVLWSGWFTSFNYKKI